MSQAPAMPLWTDALIGDTTHLSAEEFGTYMLILIATWRNNGVPFADNDARLARMCRTTIGRWQKRLRPILVSFYDLSDGRWRQKRLEKEWKYVAELSAIQSEKGKRSGEARRLKRNGTKGTAVPPRFEPEGEPNTNPQTHTHTQEGRDDANASSGEQGSLSDGRSSKRGTRLAVDWQPGEQDREFATSLGLGIGLGDVAAEFRDYWIAVPGAKGCKLDWSATFRNRCRDIAKHRGGNGSGRSAGSGSGDSQILAALSRVRLKDDVPGYH